MAWKRVDGLRTIELGNPGEQRQQLTDLVLHGSKRGTAGLVDLDYESEGEPFEQIGEQLVLVGDGGTRVALVQITALQIVPFGEVSDEFARSEGEGFAGQADWAVAHRRFWEGAGCTITDQTPVVCLSFELLGD